MSLATAGKPLVPLPRLPAFATWTAPKYLTTVGAKIYFNADDGTNDVELWVSDSTVCNMSIVKDIRTGGDRSPRYLTAINSKLYSRPTTAPSPSTSTASIGSM